VNSCNDVAVDGCGNVVVGGKYSGSVVFKPGTGTFSLPMAGGGFVATLGSTGSLV
jgi:hypothetical protein